MAIGIEPLKSHLSQFISSNLFYFTSLGSLHMQCVGKLHPDVISLQVSQLIEHLREEKVEATLFQRDSRENRSAHPREFLNKELKERPVASCWRLIYQVVFVYIYIHIQTHTHTLYNYIYKDM